MSVGPRHASRTPGRTVRAVLFVPGVWSGLKDRIKTRIEDVVPVSLSEAEVVHPLEVIMGGLRKFSQDAADPRAAEPSGGLDDLISALRTPR